MKVTVSSASGTVQVEIPNRKTLNPAAARAARNIAFGVGANATVSNGYVAYRVTRKATRRIQ